MLGPRVGGFPHVAAVQAVVEEDHVLAFFHLAVQTVLEVKVATVEGRFQLEVEAGHIRGIAHGTAVQVSFVLTPAVKARRVAQRIRRVEILRKEDCFNSHRPAFDVLGLSLDIDTHLRSIHARFVGIREVTRNRAAFLIVGGIRSTSELDRISDAHTHIGHQVEFRGHVTPDIDRCHMVVEHRRARYLDTGIVRIRAGIGKVLHLRQVFAFVNDVLIEDDAHVVHTESKIVRNLFLSDTAMVNGAAEVIATGHFKFARLTTVHTQTVAGTDIGIGRLRHKELGLHVERELVEVGKHAAEATVGPECTTTFLNRLEHLFLIVSRNSLFVFEQFVLPSKARVGFTFPHGKRRSVCPDHATGGHVGTKDACANVHTEVHFFVDGRRVEVRRVVVHHTLVLGRHLRRLAAQVVGVRTGQGEREAHVRPQGHVRVRHGHNVHVEHSVHRRTSEVVTSPGARFGIVEVLEAEGQVTRNRERKVILAHKGRFHVVSKRIDAFFHISNLCLGVKLRRSVHHQRLVRNRFGRLGTVHGGSGRFFFDRGFRNRFFYRSGFFIRAFLGCRFGFSGFCNRFFRFRSFFGRFLSGGFGSLGSRFFYGRSRFFEFFRGHIFVHLGKSQRRAAKQSRK